MPSPIEAVTTAALSAALDGASRRHALIAANIANAGTESFQPLRLGFDAHLEEARGAWREHGLRDTRLVEALRSAATLPAEPVEGGSVRIDVEEPAGVGYLAGAGTVSDLVQSLARMKTSTRDIISILRAIKAAGALHAELVVQ